MTKGRIAVIADAHFHALEADWGFDGPDGIAPRSWSETITSTRVFNESHTALIAALDDILARGITDVVLLGDYSDDGQPITVKALARLLDRYTEHHGFRFFALPGNHDVFGPLGRHRTKAFLRADGTTVTLTSDPDLDQPGQDIVYLADMRCDPILDGVSVMARFGYQKRADMLHFETPFGRSDAFEDRQYRVKSANGRTALTLMDTSYLVEPSDGLWMLMLDANVFVPTGTGQHVTDSTDAGWTALLETKRFLMEWITDVAKRARMQGKQLLTFSHYPVLDSFGDDHKEDVALFGQTAMVRRTPASHVADALSQAGVHLHFSGHLHVKRTTQVQTSHGLLTNVAVPSLAAFPTAYIIADVSPTDCVLTDVSLDDVVLDQRVQDAYQMECASTPDPPKMFEENTYGAFLRAHCRAVVWHRYVPREWPSQRAAEIDSMTLFDGMALICGPDKATSCHTAAAALNMRTVVEDWYLLRMGGPLALSAVLPERRALYLSCAAMLPPTCQKTLAAEFWRLFLKRLGDFVFQAEDTPAELTWPAQNNAPG